MRQDFPRYQEAQVQLAIIASQEPKAVLPFLKATPLPSPWLFDPQREVIRRYGVYNRVSFDAWRLAHPAAILIDNQGVIRFIYRSSHQWDIPSSSVMQGALERLKG